MARPVFTADESLIAHLRKFYSIGQLELFYCTLTDAGQMPGWSDRKRAEWTDGIAQILGKKPMVPDAFELAENTLVPEKKATKLTQKKPKDTGTIFS